MKPLRLKLQAFGPYSKEAVVDFRELENGGLFLIHGQTGAGKTSLLDGLCFSLFGKASGNDRSAEGLRSDLAAPDQPTVATLEFALGTDIFRVSRKPAQQLKKKRGEGFTTKPSEGFLEKLVLTKATEGIDSPSEAWELMAKGSAETDQVVAELIGMNEDQFRQVVVLPQGQFRKFLSSNSGDREELLETLFKTERYRLIGETLDRQSKALAEKLSKVRIERDALLASFDTVSIEALNEKVASAEEKLKSFDSASTEVETRHAKAAARLASVRELAKLTEEFKTVETKLLALEAQKSVNETRLQKLEAAGRASTVLEADQQFQSVLKDVTRLTSDAAATETSLSQREFEYKKAKTAKDLLETRASEIETFETERTELKAIYLQSRDLANELLNSKKFAASTAAAMAAVATHESKVLALRARKPELELKIQSLLLEAQSSSALKAERDLLGKRLEDSNRAVALSSELKKIEAATAKETAARSKTVEQQLSQTLSLKTLKLDYHLSQAARLAKELKIGEPCAVCGSLEHPSPAKAGARNPTLEEIDQMEADSSVIAAQVAAHDTTLGRLESQASEILKSLKHLVPAWNGQPTSILTLKAEIESQLVKIDTTLEKSLKADSLLKPAKSDLEKLNADTLAAETVGVSLATALSAAKDDAKESAGKITQLERAVPEKWRDLEKVKTEGLRLANEIDTYKKSFADASAALESAASLSAALRGTLSTLKDQLEKKSVDSIQLKSEVAKLLASKNFSSIEEARAVGLSAAQVSSLENERRTFEKEWATVHSRFDELKSKLAGADSTELVKLIEIQNEFSAIDAERTDRKAELLSLGERVRDWQSALKKLAKLDVDVTEFGKRHAVIGKLAETAAGRFPNLSRVNFQRFILASRLDEVLEQASRRLYVMSRGQFTLRRAQQAEDKRKSAGLDLEVEDSISGTARATASLSGGEGFLASLALALGLADVVQNHLGGIRLDAVFVDEGFGTLDPEALEQAMRILSDLQAGGRLVGIISHVPELRDQISRRLLIRKTSEGSDIAWES